MSKAEEKANKRWPIHPLSILPKEGEHGEIINFDEWLDDYRIWVQSFSANRGYKEGYEQAEKDILSKFTKEHLEGLKWIERTGISTQPVPYHKYCKDLYKVLEELLKEKYDIQGDTSV